MEPKFQLGQCVVIIKEVYFMFHNYTIRPGEVGKVVEIDIHLLNIHGDVVYDYIVLIRDKPMFFYEDELSGYPAKGEK